MCKVQSAHLKCIRIFCNFLVSRFIREYSVNKLFWKIKMASPENTYYGVFFEPTFRATFWNFILKTNSITIAFLSNLSVILLCKTSLTLHKKMKFSIKDFFSKYDQILNAPNHDFIYFGFQCKFQIHFHNKNTLTMPTKSIKKLVFLLAFRPFYRR